MEIKEAFLPPDLTIKVGDTIWDDLQSKPAKIARITNSGPTDAIGIWLEDDSWLGGGRHPWEISEVNTNK